MKILKIGEWFLATAIIIILLKQLPFLSEDWKDYASTAYEWSFTIGAIFYFIPLIRIYEDKVKKKTSAEQKLTKINIIIEERVNELLKADEEFCKDRWDMSKFKELRELARENSNQVTFGRQELQELAKKITKL